MEKLYECEKVSLDMVMANLSKTLLQNKSDVLLALFLSFFLAFQNTCSTDDECCVCNSEMSKFTSFESCSCRIVYARNENIYVTTWTL